LRCFSHTQQNLLANVASNIVAPDRASHFKPIF
jgi:hypothetical protein